MRSLTRIRGCLPARRPHRGEPVRWSSIVGYGATPLLLFTLLGASPPEGAELSVAGGSGRYTYSPGCGARGQAVEHIVDARLRVTDARGHSLHLQQTVAPARAVRGSEPGARLMSTSTLLRLGIHRRVWGVELGPALLAHPEGNGLALAPTARVWGGFPEVAYGYAGLLAGVNSGAAAVGAVELGVGHAGERVRAELGGSPFGNVSGRADLGFGRIWVGAEAGVAQAYDDAPLDRRALLRLTLAPRDTRAVRSAE